MNQPLDWWQKARALWKGGTTDGENTGGPAALPPPPYRLNLGCGARFHSDWINLDVAPQSPEVQRHDLREPLPFPDATCTTVYCSHVLEHFSRIGALLFLGECERVLCPGGVLRVVVPDLETIARLYLQNLDAALTGDTAAERRHKWMTLELIDQMVREESGGEMLKYWRQNPMPAEEFVLERMGAEVRGVLRQIRQQPPSQPQPNGPPTETTDPVVVAQFRDSGEVHKWMYDRLSLDRLLRDCGFTEVKVCRADESRIPDLNIYHLDIDEHGAVRKPDSLFMEGVKPPTRS